MANYRAVARRAATRYGLDPNVFVRQIQQESGFRPNARSPAGALGIAQIMPGTARGWGVDPMNPGQALNAAAKNMAGYVRQYGGIENALRAYNAGPGAIQASKGYAETNNYVRTILGSGPRATAPRAPRAGTSRAASSVTGATGSESDLLGLLGALRPQQQAAVAQRPRVQVTAPTAPTFSAGTPMAGAPSPVVTPRESAASTAQQAPERFNVGAALEALGALAPQAMAGRTSSAAGGRVPSRSGLPASGGRNGKFNISGPQPGRLKPELTSFAKQVAGVLGGTLTGSDGSTHSRLTTTGNVSEHYTGNATDIFTINGKPARGKRLIAAGRAALIAAGMPRAKALRAPAGLYNVGNHQIIFGTNSRALGGDHTDHLHISTHARR